MSGYRPFYKKIWNDPDFQEVQPSDKLLFIYFFTNNETNESGIYPLTPKTTSRETGLPQEEVEQRFAKGLTTVDQWLANGSPTVGKRFTNGCIKNIFYDPENKLIFVKNLKKYNMGGRNDLVFKAIANEYNSYKHSRLWELFFEFYPEYGDISTVNQPLENRSTTVNQPTDTIRYDKDTIKKEDANEIRRTVMAQIKELRGYDTRNRGAEISAINEMIKEGIGADSIVKAYKIIKEQDWWKNKYLSLTYVHKDIHEVLKEKPKMSKHSDGWR